MQINELKDAYKGHRAFLLGNGYSLNVAPFDKLKDEYTFAVNRIGRIFEETDWRPTFYVAVSSCIQDAKFIDWRPDIHRAMRDAEIVFIWNHLCKNLDEFNDKFVKLECQDTGHIEAENAADGLWRRDLTNGVSKYGASLFTAAQIAVYMGFDRLIFIGLDGYTGDKDNFADDYRTEAQATDPNGNEGQRRAFEIVKAASEKQGFEVYLADISHGYGVFEKVSLDDIF